MVGSASSLIGGSRSDGPCSFTTIAFTWRSRSANSPSTSPTKSTLNASQSESEKPVSGRSCCISSKNSGARRVRKSSTSPCKLSNVWWRRFVRSTCNRFCSAACETSSKRLARSSLPLGMSDVRSRLSCSIAFAFPSRSFRRPAKLAFRVRSSVRSLEAFRSVS
ncbi:hypothetical protein D3C81_1230020 [compost metagenome]